MTGEQPPQQPPGQPQSPPMPRVGARVYDRASGRYGIVTDIQGRPGPHPTYVLRPVNGPFNDVWMASPRQLRETP